MIIRDFIKLLEDENQNLEMEFEDINDDISSPTYVLDDDDGTCIAGEVGGKLLIWLKKAE